MTLSFEQTVPRSLVHRAALAEVYIADSAQTGEREFELAVQIPRAHSVWFDRRAPYHDPLSMAEAARQGVYVVVGRHLGLPAGSAFSLRRLQLEVQDLERYRDDRPEPLQGVLTLSMAEHVAGAGDLGTMRFDGHVAIDDAVAMTVAGDLAYLRHDDYAALRAFQRQRAPQPLPPPAAGPTLEAAAVGRRDRRNCVLGALDPGATGIYPLVIDESHPAFFDHAYDHVPGPLIVEAFRQAALVTAHRAGALPSPVAAIRGCRAEFTRFAELDARIDCHVGDVERGDEGQVRVTVGLVQLGAEIARADVELERYPDGTPLA